MNKSRFLISSEAITLLSKFQERGQNVVKGERTRRKERKWRPQITVPTAKLQPSRATVLTQPSQLKDMQRPPRRMGKKSYGTYGEPTDVSYTQAQSTATYRQTTYVTSYGQPPTGDTTPTAPRHTASLYKDVALVLMTPPLLQSPQPKPLVQLSLHMAPSLHTQPMASSQQPLHLQDHRM